MNAGMLVRITAEFITDLSSTAVPMHEVRRMKPGVTRAAMARDSGLLVLAWIKF
jgi:hypothetical protein